MDMASAVIEGGGKSSGYMVSDHVLRFIIWPLLFTLRETVHAGKNFGHCLRKCGKWQYDARAPDPDAASLTNPKYGQAIGFVDPKLSLES